MRKSRFLPIGTPDEPQRLDSLSPPRRRRRSLLLDAVNLGLWLAAAVFLIDWSGLWPW